MATQVVMPKLSPTMEEGQLSRWLKQEGDQVSMGEPLAEIDTDKATMEMQALGSGVLRKILIGEGESAPLGQLIAIIGEPDEDISALLGKAGSGEGAAPGKSEAEEPAEAVDRSAAGRQEVTQGASTDKHTQQETTKLNESVGGDDGSGTDTGGQDSSSDASRKAQTTSGNGARAASGDERQTGGRLIVSPLAARMAAEAGIDLRSLSGSGPGGRIVKRDIEAAMSAGTKVSEQPSTQEAAPPRHLRAVEASAQPVQQSSIAGASGYRDEPMTEMRRTIARRLVTSLGPVPHFFLTTEIEMDKAAEIRRQINEIDPEIKVSINDFIIKVAAAALLQHPQVNASFQEKDIRYYE